MKESLESVVVNLVDRQYAFVPTAAACICCWVCTDAFPPKLAGLLKPGVLGHLASVSFGAAAPSVV